MAVFSRQALRALVERPRQAGVSIYMPTHRLQDSTEDSIRLKNLLRDAERKLVQSGLRVPEAREIVRPAEAFLPDAMFWQHQGDGLAIFSAPGFYRQYRLPYAFPVLVYVGQRFHIKPLLTFLAGNSLFYVLAASQRRVRLLQCTADSCRDVTPEGVPADLADATKFESYEKGVSRHSLGGGAGGGAVVQGASAAKGDTKDEIKRFFEQINRALMTVLAGEQAPLLFAGVDFMGAIFRQTSHYRHVMEPNVTGNPDAVTDAELHRQAWAILKPYFEQDRDRALDRYCAAISKGYATSDLKEALIASREGRVDSLFVAMGVERWGTFDPDQLTMELHDAERPGDEDLLDAASVYTLLTDGAVYPLPPEKVPGVPPIAALYRF